MDPPNHNCHLGFITHILFAFPVISEINKIINLEILKYYNASSARYLSLDQEKGFA